MKHFTNTDNPIDFPQSVDEIDQFINGYADRLENMSDKEWENLGKSRLIHKKGNLLDLAEAGEFDIVVQGCNCFNTMGGGIAREIRERYPTVASVDMETVKGDYNKLGTWTECDAGEKSRFTVINAYTQYNMSKGTDVFEYTAFELILQKLCHAYGTKRIGLPYIGMGLAGGDADVIMEQIEYFAQKVAAQGGSVTLVEFA
jgi:O-acetyl-ADP-ribose deacetylase (regulator of RNase III)